MKNKPKKSDFQNLERDLLTKTFAPSVTLITYKGVQPVSVRQVSRYDLVCENPENNAEELLKKIDVMFAIKTDTLNTVKVGITLNKDVKARNLRTPEKRKDRSVVLTQKDLDRGQNRDVRIVMRSGHVLRGVLRSYSPYNLVIEIAGAAVLVYRHGLLQYSVTPQQKQKPNTEKRDTTQ